MKFIPIIVAVIISLALLSGCKVDALSAFDAQGDLTLYVYGSGRPFEPQKIKVNSAIYKKLRDWVANNKTGWSHTPATYVPSVMVLGETFSLNFLDSSVILNYEGGQYIKQIDVSEYAFLNKQSEI